MEEVTTKHIRTAAHMLPCELLPSFMTLLHLVLEFPQILCITRSRPDWPRVGECSRACCPTEKAPRTDVAPSESSLQPTIATTRIAIICCFWCCVQLTNWGLKVNISHNGICALCFPPFLSSILAAVRPDSSSDPPRSSLQRGAHSVCNLPPAGCLPCFLPIATEQQKLTHLINIV